MYIYIIYTDPHLPMSNHIFMYSCPQKDAAGRVSRRLETDAFGTRFQVSQFSIQLVLYRL